MVCRTPFNEYSHASDDAYFSFYLSFLCFWISCYYDLFIYEFVILNYFLAYCVRKIVAVYQDFVEESMPGQESQQQSR